jgi:hypothetical protein
MTGTSSIPPSNNPQPGSWELSLIGGSAAFLAMLLVFDLLPMVAGRWLFALSVGATVFLELRFSRLLFLVTPVFLLGAVSGIAFSVVPVTGHWLLERLLPIDETSNLFWVAFRPVAEAYIGDISERVVLVFSFVCVAVYVLFRSKVQLSETRLFPALADRPVRWLIGCSVLYSLTFILPGIGFISPFPGEGVLKTAFGPVQSIVFIYLLHIGLTGDRVRLVLPLTVGALAFAAMFILHYGKIPMFIMFAGVLYAVFVRANRRLFWRALVLTPVLLILAFQLVQTVRKPESSVIGSTRPSVVYAAEVVSAKVIWRQMETGYCLHNVVKQHGDNQFDLADQFFWIEILIPRAIWPDKQEFSLGSVYAHQYCGLPKGGYHSASITLLGQPIIKSGFVGALVHGAILICLLTLGGVLAQAFAAGRVFIMALFPWWFDFDQDFAIYIGHLVKFSLIMLPVFLFTLLGPKQITR